MILRYHVHLLFQLLLAAGPPSELLETSRSFFSISVTYICNIETNR
jgi:hypothetical protein